MYYFIKITHNLKTIFKFIFINYEKYITLTKLYNYIFIYTVIVLKILNKLYNYIIIQIIFFEKHFE